MNWNALKSCCSHKLFHGPYPEFSHDLLTQLWYILQIESSLSGVFQIQKPDINLICTEFVHCPVPYPVDLENFFEIHSLIIPVLEYPADTQKNTQTISIA